VYPSEPWLDVNATYTYSAEHTGAWAPQFHVYRNCGRDYVRQPPRPFLLIESTYEKEHDAPAQKIRRQAYWAWLSGACGQAMGNGLIWSFKPGWEAELDSRASRDMQQLGRLFAARPWWELVPDFQHRVVTAGYGTYNDTNQPGGDDYAPTAATPDGRVSITYLPTPRTIRVNLGLFHGPVYARWFDPTDGTRREVRKTTFPNRHEQDFTPPSRNAAGDSDFVLLLETSAIRIQK
jgi:hypothetical protein